MITQTKYRLLIGVVLFLFVMNVATIASLVYHTRQPENGKSGREAKEAGAYQAEKGARFFREQLNLDTLQTNRFREINRAYNRSANMITWDLEQLRVEMVEEMGKVEPDTVRLNTISREIGDHHEQLKKLTVNYYLKMKSVCDDNQQVKLNAIFREMVQKEDSATTRQPGGRGYRWRGGRE